MTKSNVVWKCVSIG